MMNWNLNKYLLSLSYLLFCLSALAKDPGRHSGLYLFTDRTYCTSGDTVWFRVFKNDTAVQESNVIHVQLSSAGDRIVTAVAVKSNGTVAEGYIHVPDSLSTGVYFLSAFQRNSATEEPGQHISASLCVYHRFSEQIEAMAVPVNEDRAEIIRLNDGEIIQTDKAVYESRQPVSVALNLEAVRKQGVNRVVVRAERTNDLASGKGRYFKRMAETADLSVSGFAEHNGILIDGTVKNRETGEAGENVVVLLSLLNDPQYLDYYITGNNGKFNFFLKDAVGTAEVILQAVSENNQDWEVSPEPDYLRFTNPITTEDINLTARQSGFIGETVDAAYFTRLFHNSYEVKLPEFSMPRRFEFPIYGKPYGRLVLADYYDLPDFHEISRELLHGLKYRSRGDQITIRMLNLVANEYFTSEPLRMINGIPVFNNRMFASMGSEDIDYIDYVLEDRIYGDLRFSGVLAIYLKDNSTAWMTQQPNLFRFTMPLLQPGHTCSYSPSESLAQNIPDFRQVYYWQVLDTGNHTNFEFMLSDLKGEVTITVEGVTAEGVIVNSSETIEVK